jgi:predicted alpha/beta-hydrolase family hydrolase
VKKSTFRIAVGGGDVGAISYPAATPIAALLLAHGAGAPQRHPYMVGTAERLRARGLSIVTFDFEYTERGRKAPDPNDVLEACLAAAFDATRARIGPGLPLFAGGKSMGGRIATQCAAKETIVPRGLVLLGYPLHPPGKPEQRRDRHLPRVRAPMLFVQGTRDAFGTAGEVAPLVVELAKTAPGTRLHEVVGGDHSHVVLKKQGVAQGEVDIEIADTIAGWVRSLLVS